MSCRYHACAQVARSTQLPIVVLAVGGWVLASATAFLVTKVALLLGLFVVPVSAGVLLEIYSSARRRRGELDRLRTEFLAERKHPELPSADEQ